MGQFTERSPLGKEGKKGAPSPSLGRPWLGFLGRADWPYPGHRRPCSSPWPPPPGCLGGGLRCNPSPLYKGGPLEEEMHNTIHEPLHLAALLHPWCTGHTLAAALSLSHSRIASRKAAYEKGITAATRRRVVEFPDPYPKPSTSTSRLETGFWESSWLSYVCEYAKVPLVRCRSRWSKIFTTLRSATSSLSSMLVRERNPRISIYEGTCPNSYRYSITKIGPWAYSGLRST
jgi:hypothetical protein